jgi:hypothetical protein
VESVGRIALSLYLSRPHSLLSLPSALVPSRPSTTALVHVADWRAVTDYRLRRNGVAVVTSVLLIDGYDSLFGLLLVHMSTAWLRECISHLAVAAQSKVVSDCSRKPVTRSGVSVTLQDERAENRSERILCDYVALG